MNQMERCNLYYIYIGICIQPSSVWPQIIEAIQRKAPHRGKNLVNNSASPQLVSTLISNLGPFGGTCQSKRVPTYVQLTHVDSPEDTLYVTLEINICRASPPEQLKPGQPCIHQTEPCRPSDQQLELDSAKFQIVHVHD